MTPARRSFLYALGIILTGLAGRAAIDKLLAGQGGGEAVALWAQLQSVVEMVAGIVGIGIGQGLTVLVAQQAEKERRRRLLGSALLLGGGVGAAVALLVSILIASGAGPVAAWFPSGPALGILAALAGWLGIAAGVVSAGWLGRQRQDRVFWLAAALLLAPLLAALGGGGPETMLAAQAAASGVVALVVVHVVGRAGNAGRREVTARRRWSDFFGSCWRTDFRAGGIARPLLAYVPVGLVISLASPLALILIRGEVSSVLSWQDAGRLQAIWRAADWVTAIVAGLLATVALPRLSAAVADGKAAFSGTLQRIALRTMLPGALALFSLWLMQREVLSALYDERFVVSSMVAGAFFLGDLLRIASWVILFALLARRATVWVTVGECLSMPLFAVLVLTFSDGLTLERAAIFYALTYAVYLAFNLLGLRAVFRGWRP